MRTFPINQAFVEFPSAKCIVVISQAESYMIISLEINKRHKITCAQQHDASISSEGVDPNFVFASRENWGGLFYAIWKHHCKA